MSATFQNRRAAYALLLLVYILVGLWIARDSLNYYWNLDDFHLVRTFSGAELKAVWMGHWDPDQWETPGLRPLTTWFNHFRALAFGESTAAHRIFLIVLFAAYLVLFVRLMTQLGSPWWVGALAGMLTLCAKYNYFHFVWIADGIHLFCGLLALGAAHFLLADVDEPKAWKHFGAIGLVTAALLAREDSLAVLPAIVLCACLYAARQAKRGDSVYRLGRFVVLTAVAVLVFFVWRRIVVPESVMAFQLRGFASHIYLMLTLAGRVGLLKPAFVLFAAALVLAATRLPANERAMAGFWLFCGVVACTPGLVLTRTNLLLFAISFYSAFVVTVLAGVLRNSKASAALATAAVAVTCVLATNESRTQQRSLHPMSAEQVLRDWVIVYGPCAKCVIPPERSAHLQQKLDGLGVSMNTDFDTWNQELRDQGRIGPRNPNGPFAAEESFLDP